MDPGVMSSRLLAPAIAIAAIASCKPAAAPVDATSGGKAAAGEDLRLDPTRVVAEWKGGSLTYGELRKKREAAFKKIYNKYLQDMYQAEQRELETFVIETLVKEAAAKKGQSEQDYLQSIAGNPTVSDEDIQAFYDQNVKQSGQPLDAVRDRIRGYLAGTKQRDMVRAEIDRLKSEAGVKLDLPPPETAVVSFDLSGRPVKGNPNAKVTIVEFSDFECPYCGQAAPNVNALADQFKEDVKVVFLHFPLNFHPNAMPAALASQCANAQGKFWEFHDKLFANQKQLGPSFYESTAGELGLDVEKFKKCVDDPATKAYVMRDMEQGETAGVEGTPSFYVNGVASAAGVPTADTIRPLLERKPD
jgi:protein-disulfide isomerase